jgi:serine/threonine-protein kinase
MATVYLAEEVRHGREVALKVLRADLGAAMGRERFLREIQLAARLSHPHILPLFDSGEAAGALWYTMPVATGESLRTRLDRERLLPVDEAVRVAREVAGALAHAHAQGIVHRDIKPENILIQSGHALVADFGIGKALDAVDVTAMTATGVAIGTPAYLSPEQAVGDAVDGRSDLYALGCVLYEMLTGEPPFTGPNVQAVIAKRFVQTPADVQALREGVPRPIALAVQKALQRTPIDRFETAEQFAAALVETPPVESAAPSPFSEAVGTSGRAASSALGPSLAVLPFVSLSRDASDEDFADGVTEELLNALAQTPGLRVAGRSSAFAFKGTNTDLRAVGLALSVSTVLEGTLRRAGTRVRITVQLVDARDGYQLWSERYERVLDDIFALQDEIAAAITARLRLSLVTGNRPAPTRSLAAYELYLRGRKLLYRRGPSIPKAIECFEQALELDGEYAQAWAGLAQALFFTAFSGHAPPPAIMARAAEAARRAVQLDGNSPEALTALGVILALHEREDEAATQAFERALTINPQYAEAIEARGIWHLAQVLGRVDEGLALVREGLRYDPLSAGAHAIVCIGEIVSDNPLAGIAFGQRAVELDPDSFVARYAHASALLLANRATDAVQVLQGTLERFGPIQRAELLRAIALEQAGRHEDADTLVSAIEATRVTTYLQPCPYAMALAHVRGIDAALPEFRRAVAERDPQMPVFARHRLNRTWWDHRGYREALAPLRITALGASA